ncbi:MAG TPA: response regulator, partial [Cystobacter sp.]
MDERITTRARVLVEDEDPDQLDLVRRTLAPHFDVQTHDSALGVSNLVRQGEPDLVLLDVNFPALKGDQVLTLARRYAPRGTKFILYSATDESRLRAL